MFTKFNNIKKKGSGGGDPGPGQNQILYYQQTAAFLVSMGGMITFLFS